MKYIACGIAHSEIDYLKNRNPEISAEELVGQFVNDYTRECNQGDQKARDKKHVTDFKK